jgi:hypothetical protein
MDMQPEVIPITDFRRDTARIINGPVAAGKPVYVTQCGYVTVVALSLESYRDILRELADARRAASRAPAAAPPAEGNLFDDFYGPIDEERADALEADGWDLE